MKFKCICTRIAGHYAPFLLGNLLLTLFYQLSIPSLPHSTTTLLSHFLYFPFQSFCSFIALICNYKQGDKKIIKKRSGCGFYFLQLIISRHGDHLGKTCKILNSLPFYFFPSLSYSSWSFLPFPAFSCSLKSFGGRTHQWTEHNFK